MDVTGRGGRVVLWVRPLAGALLTIRHVHPELFTACAGFVSHYLDLPPGIPMSLAGLTALAASRCARPATENHLENGK